MKWREKKLCLVKTIRIDKAGSSNQLAPACHVVITVDHIQQSSYGFFNIVPSVWYLTEWQFVRCANASIPMIDAYVALVNYKSHIVNTDRNVIEATVVKVNTCYCFCFLINVPLWSDLSETEVHQSSYKCSTFLLRAEVFDCIFLCIFHLKLKLLKNVCAWENECS